MKMEAYPLDAHPNFQRRHEGREGTKRRAARYVLWRNSLRPMTYGYSIICRGGCRRDESRPYIQDCTCIGGVISVKTPDLNVQRMGIGVRHLHGSYNLPTIPAPLMICLRSRHGCPPL
jgi:hypothetical protein